MFKLPANTGLFTVCCTDVITKYGPDRLLFRLYYPTSADVSLSEDTAGSWAGNLEYVTGYISFFQKLSNYSRESFSSTKINAILNGDFVLPKSITKLPIVIFSHGVGSNKTAYSSICTDLASKGVLVAAVEHADGSACASYFLKEEPPEVKKIWTYYTHLGSNDTGHSLRNERVHFRANECCALLDEIQQINNGLTNYPHCEINLKCFKDVIDVKNCAIMGHSFGASSAIAALAKDNRFKVGVGLDAWMYPLDSEVYKKVSPVPFLFINSEAFQWDANIVDMRKLDGDVFNIDVERKMVTLVGTHHFSQSDLPFVIENNDLMNFCDTTKSSDPTSIIKLNNQLAFGFLGKHLDLDFGNSVDDVVASNANLVYFGSNIDVEEDAIEKAKQELQDLSL